MTTAITHAMSARTICALCNDNFATAAYLSSSSACEPPALPVPGPWGRPPPRAGAADADVGAWPVLALVALCCASPLRPLRLSPAVTGTSLPSPSSIQEVVAM
eukprot:CAMPEP_0180645538 /NCGR_PEP_ID=MMETSP1037_2-20121125/49055_1 /TAXON_ID=632150 /ORGANISM="Azadinium spinosum, Strain 3D9" /LENGTH=102 /DNA_ID=CAMNT_0022669427 /DNA_START=222 /DNA_END=527 /DNA_ORIENTATION=-